MGDAFETGYDKASFVSVPLKLYATPLVLLLITICSVFLGEVVVMLILHHLPPLPSFAEAIADGLMLTILMFPPLYVLLFRPMMLHIAKRGKAERELQRANEELEHRVNERTADLSSANKRLQSEIEERKRTEKELRKSQDFIARVVESAPCLIGIYDLTQRRFDYMNGRVNELLGYTPEDVYLKGAAFLGDVLSPKDLSSFGNLSASLATAEDTEVIDRKFRMKHAKGEWRLFRVQMGVFSRAADGAPREILFTAS